MELLIEQLSKW